MGENELCYVFLAQDEPFANFRLFRSDAADSTGRPLARAPGAAYQVCRIISCKKFLVGKNNYSNTTHYQRASRWVSSGDESARVHNRDADESVTLLPAALRRDAQSGDPPEGHGRPDPAGVGAQSAAAEACVSPGRGNAAAGKENGSTLDSKSEWSYRKQEQRKLRSVPSRFVQNIGSNSFHHDLGKTELEVLFFVDAYDALVEAGEAAILTRFQNLQNAAPQCRVFFSGEKHCGSACIEGYVGSYASSPAKNETKNAYNKYLCSGGFVGEADAVADLFEKYPINEFARSYPKQSEQYYWALVWGGEYKQQLESGGTYKTPFCLEDESKIFASNRNRESEERPDGKYSCFRSKSIDRSWLEGEVDRSVVAVNRTAVFRRTIGCL